MTSTSCEKWSRLWITKGCEPRYKLVVDADALRALFGCRPTERQRLIRFFDSLALNPFQSGDCELRLPNDRTYQVKFLQPFKITYWADHATKDLRVVDIETLRP